MVGVSGAKKREILPRHEGGVFPVQANVSRAQPDDAKRYAVRRVGKTSGKIKCHIGAGARSENVRAKSLHSKL